MAGGLNRNITVRLLADTSKFTAGMAKVSAEAEKTSTTMEASGGKTKLLTAGIAAAGIAASGARLVDHMRHDKKMAAGTLPFLLARGIGQTYLDKTVDLADVAAFLDRQPR